MSTHTSPTAYTSLVVSLSSPDSVVYSQTKRGGAFPFLAATLSTFPNGPSEILLVLVKDARTVLVVPLTSFTR